MIFFGDGRHVGLAIARARTLNHPLQNNGATLAVERVAEAAVQQLKSCTKASAQSVSNLLLSDYFALGYVNGFAQQADRHVNMPDDERATKSYIEGVYVNLLDKPWTASNYVALSDFDRKNTIFHAGYQIGLTDLNDWVLSGGRGLPFGLAEHLR